MPTPDPMDTIPTDHGSDRYDYVEVTAPSGVRPIGEWWDKLISVPCPDCRANIFAKYVGPATLGPTTGNRQHWHITFAHDSDCPTLARIEKGPTGV